MKRGPAHLLAVTFCVSLLLIPVGNVQAQFLKKLFSKDLEKAPSAPEMHKQESQAAALFAAAESAEASGNSGKALSLARKASINYPLTASAGKAQFKVAELMEKDGKLTKAFDEYQEFITTYRQSPQYAAAIERQFKIASTAMDDKASSFLGLKTTTPKSQVIEMFEKVIGNAPRTPYAAQSQFRIGELYQEQSKVAEATDAFQKVVDDYPGSDLSSEAAYRMANVNLATVERSKDSSNVRTARSDLESAVSRFPDAEERGDALEALSSLDETEAGKSMSIAKFYEKRGNSRAAAIYYMDVARSGTTFAPEARNKLNELSVNDLELGALAPSAQGGALDSFSVPSRDDGASAGLLGGPSSYAPTPTIKTRPDYLGPPAPGLDKLLEKPQMRTSLPPTFTSPEPPLPSAPAIPPPPSNSLVDSIDLETPLTDIPESPSIPVAPDTKLTEETVPKSLEEIEKALKEVVPAAGETTEPAEPDPAP
jgi:outer membrane protein assembly factor BamD